MDARYYHFLRSFVGDVDWAVIKNVCSPPVEEKSAPSHWGPRPRHASCFGFSLAKWVTSHQDL